MANENRMNHATENRLLSYYRSLSGLSIEKQAQQQPNKLQLEQCVKRLFRGQAASECLTRCLSMEVLCVHIPVYTKTSMLAEHRRLYDDFFDDEPRRRW